ncbi:hypothetical protein KK062_07160 [Fulvivirgaceae bacterium PWU5]|uniref:DUF7033 domain-containing protein n=1 Tax=Dawidia cretensis TaxID=2782350 RepID=A0AAP2DV38_9BACT|nr:hypothetical protein [Dawidia cretensis]MBT1707993.1 hypothetical protein [Dawidia cretensis]
MVKFYLYPEVAVYQPPISYILKIWSKHTGAAMTFSPMPDGALTIGTSADATFRISGGFQPNDFGHDALSPACMLLGADGQPDVLRTAFYLINTLQEYNDSQPDSLGRFQYASSYQHRLGVARKNIVQECFDTISKAAGISPRQEKTHFMLSHDIDLVNRAMIEDGFNVLKKGRIDQFLAVLMRVAMGRPDWLNIDQIVKLESLYDCRSVFFWIVNRGGLNADYTFHSPRMQRQFEAVTTGGSENGLHKSISEESLAQELQKYQRGAISNRYHYLKFHLPQAYHDIETAGLKLDASVGFAEEAGFRNNYGLPFNPYNFQAQKPFSFIEVPLHVMDRTYFQYKKFTPAEAEKDILGFFDQHRENCVLSVLWHNNFFTNYKFKGYLDLYKKILAYIRDNKFTTISQQEIINQYSIH